MGDAERVSGPADPAALKAALREAALARRVDLDPEAAGARLAAQILAGLTFPQDSAVSGVWPLEGEIDLRPLLVALHEKGHAILLPQTTPKGNPLIFRRWTPGAAMVRERFGTFRPDGEIGVPDILLVPLLAFDRAGNRLGYGGGYYDRTLEALPGRRAIGFGFAEQEVAALPTEAHDQPLHAIATDREIIHLPAPRLPGGLFSDALT